MTRTHFAKALLHISTSMLYLRSSRFTEIASFLLQRPIHNCMGRDRSVDTATRYGLDGPRIEFRLGGGVFPHPFRQAVGPGPIQPPAQWVPGLFPGDKAAGAWR